MESIFVSMTLNRLVILSLDVPLTALFSFSTFAEVADSVELTLRRSYPKLPIAIITARTVHALTTPSQVGIFACSAIGGAEGANVVQIPSSRASRSSIEGVVGVLRDIENFNLKQRIAKKKVILGVNYYR